MKGMPERSVDVTETQRAGDERSAAGRGVKLVFWLTYDNLGRVALVSVLFWLVSLPIVTIPAALGGLAERVGV